MTQTCTQCSKDFSITDADLQFYDKVSPVFHGKKYAVPPPTLCAQCRAQRRMTHFNYEFLYRNTSKKSGKSIISSFSADKPYTVYEPKEWWGDQWDALEYGHEYDFSQSFFEQSEKLQQVVPVMSLVIDSNENSEYAQYSGWNKNCYLSFCTDYCEDCMYTHSVYYSKNTVDCFLCQKAELCYECVHCNDCYNLVFSRGCQNCSDSAFLYDCRGCKNCFGCTGLHRKEYCFFNEQLRKEQYEAKIREYPLNTIDIIVHMKEKMQTMIHAHPCQAVIGINNQNSTGDFLFQCKDCKECYDCTDIEDCAFCNSMRGGKDCYDLSHWGHPAELCYECGGVGEGASRLLFCYCCWPNCADLLYCNFCSSCHDCFGCIGLKHKEYCIFNKQYSKEEYNELVPKIIASMQEKREWGEYFPVRMSPYCYNETPAQKYYPLSKEEVLKRGWQWKVFDDTLPQVEKVIDASKLPASINSIPDDVLNWAITCSTTKRPFKIIKQELQFYRDMQLPLPRIHPDERLRKRMTQINPRKLWKRTCNKCSKEIQTTYNPSRPEVVYCESCYLKEVY